MITMGKIDTSVDLMMKMSYVYIYIYIYISMLEDTPPQDKLYNHLHILNACEHTCFMMTIVGSKISKT